jgi:hypothetical protein
MLDATHAVQGGKDGRLRVLDLRSLGDGTAHRGGESQSVATPSGSALFTAPAIWRRGDTVWVFAADNGGTAAYTYRGGALTKAWSATTAGTSPVVAGGMLFVYDPGGTLHVFEPTTGNRWVNSLPAADTGTVQSSLTGASRFLRETRTRTARAAF